MERRIRRLGIAIVLLFTLLFGQLAYVQVFAADDIKSHPANFSRQLIAEYNVQRGKILTADGLVLAESVPAPEGSRYRYERRYPQGDLYGYITGFYSRIYGRSALEQSMNSYLSGEAPELAISTFSDLFLGRPKRGANIFVTIDPNLQEVARTALGGNEGAVVAMDPRSGDVLALYSTPGFDPSELSSGSDEEMRSEIYDVIHRVLEDHELLDPMLPPEHLRKVVDWATDMPRLRVITTTCVSRSISPITITESSAML